MEIQKKLMQTEVQKKWILTRRLTTGTRMTRKAKVGTAKAGTAKAGTVKAGIAKAKREVTRTTTRYCKLYYTDPLCKAVSCLLQDK